MSRFFSTLMSCLLLVSTLTLAYHPTSPLQMIEPPIPVDPRTITAANADRVTMVGSLADGIIRGLSWSQNGNQIAIAGPAAIRIYNIRDMSAMSAAAFTLSDFNGAVDDAVYSPDGRFLAVGDSSGSLSLWDTETYAPVAKLEGEGGVIDMAFGSNSTQIAVAHQDTGVRVWDIRDITNPAILRQFDGNGGSLQFIADSRQIVLVDEHGAGVTILDTQTGETRSLTEGLGLNTSNQYIDSWAISPNGKYATVIIHAELDQHGENNLYNLVGWDTETGEALALNSDLTKPGREPYSAIRLQFDPTGESLLLSIGWPYELRFYSVKTGVFTAMTTSDIYTSAFSPDGSLLALDGDNGDIHLYAGQRFVDTLSTNWAPILELAFSPNGMYLASLDSDNIVWIWDMATHQILGTAQFERLIQDFLLAPDETFLVNDRGKWDIAANTRSQNLDVNFYRPPHVLRSDGLLIYNDTGYGHDESTLIVKDSETGAIMQEITLPSSHVQLSMDGNLVAYSTEDQAVIVLDMNRNEVMGKFPSYAYMPHDFLISPDDRLLVAFETHYGYGVESSETFLRIWEIATGNLLVSRRVSSEYAESEVYSPDGTRIAWASFETRLYAPVFDEVPLIVFDMATETEAAFSIPYNQRYNFVFNADGSLIALGDSEGNIHLMSSEAGEEVTVLKRHFGEIYQLTFNRDGTRLYSSGADGLIYIWGINGEKIPDILTCRTNRPNISETDITVMDVVSVS